MLEIAIALIVGRPCPRCSEWTMRKLLGLNGRGEDLYSCSNKKCPMYGRGVPASELEYFYTLAWTPPLLQSG